MLRQNESHKRRLIQETKEAQSMTKKAKEEPDVANVDAEIDIVYQRLKHDFALTLPGKVTALENVIETARSHPSDQEAFERALREIHRAKGTMGSYGFRELADLLGTLERVLECLSTDKNFWRHAYPSARQILDEAKERAAIHADTTGSA